MKLDRSKWIDRKQKYYEWAADRFVIYGLLELSGPSYTKFEDILPYFYDKHVDFSAKSEIVKPFKYLSQL